MKGVCVHVCLSDTHLMEPFIEESYKWCVCVFEAFFTSLLRTELCNEDTLQQMCWGFKGIAKAVVFMYQR